MIHGNVILKIQDKSMFFDFQTISNLNDQMIRMEFLSERENLWKLVFLLIFSGISYYWNRVADRYF